MLSGRHCNWCTEYQHHVESIYHQQCSLMIDPDWMWVRRTNSFLSWQVCSMNWPVLSVFKKEPSVPRHLCAGPDDSKGRQIFTLKVLDAWLLCTMSAVELLGYIWQPITGPLKSAASSRLRRRTAAVQALSILRIQVGSTKAGLLMLPDRG